MLNAEDIVSRTSAKGTSAKGLPMKSWVWLIIGEYLEIVVCIHMQGVSRQFYKFLTPHRLS